MYTNELFTVPKAKGKSQVCIFSVVGIKESGLTLVHSARVKPLAQKQSPFYKVAQVRLPQEKKLSEKTYSSHNEKKGKDKQINRELQKESKPGQNFFWRF